MQSRGSLPAVVILQSVALGVAIYALVLLSAAFVPVEGVTRGPADLDTPPELGRVLFFALLVAPIVESALILVPGWLIQPGKSWGRAAAYYAVVFALALAIHLPSSGTTALPKSLGFVALAWWFARLQPSLGLGWAFVAIAVSHFAWNASAFAAWAIRASM